MNILVGGEAVGEEKTARVIWRHASLDGDAHDLLLGARHWGRGATMGATSSQKCGKAGGGGTRKGRLATKLSWGGR